eukprot:gnl/TRDRNA2_/TRDRNA2_154610_c0_seq1.p2 gnl/TRDRNA2_/TRDRNA2_154610_c0~~gnl/TRDRNA2_/TRDRNA2_154610_c0_seq1.p2  ORF type:complete len:128 (+),score=6.23 gnl/TRDRNA2_/TRDRNA2_154610_c0_seq1:402-785(+)
MALMVISEDNGLAKVEIDSRTNSPVHEARIPSFYLVFHFHQGAVWQPSPCLLAAHSRMFSAGGPQGASVYVSMSPVPTCPVQSIELAKLNRVMLLAHYTSPRKPWWEVKILKYARRQICVVEEINIC